jgi:hypothetical protein
MLFFMEEGELWQRAFTYASAQRSGQSKAHSRWTTHPSACGAFPNAAAVTGLFRLIADDMRQRRLGYRAGSLKHCRRNPGSWSGSRERWRPRSPFRRNTIFIALFESDLLRACPAKMKWPVLSFLSWRRIATARGDNGARCSRPAFMRPKLPRATNDLPEGLGSARLVPRYAIRS